MASRLKRARCPSLKVGCLFKRCVLTALLPLLSLNGTFAADIGAEPTEVEKTMALVDSLLGYGYEKSALHYLKQMRRTAKLSDAERLRVDEKITGLEGKISQSSKSTLPDLEVMVHFDTPNSITKTISDDVSTPRDPLRPMDFPSNRINKKAWIISGLAIVGVGVIAYHVTKHLRQKKPSAPNSVTIEF